MQAQSIDEVDAAVREGIDRGIYPAAVVVIGRGDSIIYARGYGHFTWNPASAVPTPDSTLWDIASRHTPKSDPRRTVDRIIDLNGLPGPVVQPGQHLRLPAR